MWQIEVIRSFNSYVAFTETTGCQADTKHRCVTGLQRFLDSGRHSSNCRIFAVTPPGHYLFEKGAYPLPANAHPGDPIKGSSHQIL